MTLRFRLVLALLVLVTAGLALFGTATYTLYANSEYRRMDDQLRSSAPLIGARLYQASTGASYTPDLGGRSGPPTRIPPDSYAELRDPSGTVLARATLSSTTSRPDLPATIDVGPDGEAFFDTGSVTGATRWRVYADARQPNGNMVVSAVPLSSVTTPLHRLVLIELVAAAVILALLGVGSWLILRRGLRPLEEMATSARQITDGDLSVRVAVPDAESEVGQLGEALNTMLDEIEDAFRARDATEDRLRQFLADASHELRTPLTSIQGFAELFRLGAEHDHVDLAVSMRRIEEESARMRSLVDDLLLLARLDQTRPVEQAPVDLTVLAADACSDAVAIEPGRPVTLDAPEPVVVRGDQDHLRQAVANLVTNALRHTPAGTPLEVATRLEGTEALVRVSDRGPGLDEATLAHAFDRFWQADKARTASGAGLGLSIVAGVAAEHGGRAVARNREGGGAEFEVHLPVGGVPGPPD